MTLVPAGSTLVVTARPAELWANDATARVVAALFPADQLDRFSQRTGVDPRELSELVVAEHPDGRVVLARGPFDAELAVREAGERMAPLESSVDEPLVRRAGFLGARRIDVAALDEHAVGWVDGTPQLAARVFAMARQPPPARRHALAGEGASALRARFGDAPFALFAPRPLGLPLDTGVGMLLARQRLLAAAARVTEDGALRVDADFRGEFPTSAHDNFRTLARSLAETDLGAALGLREALPSLRIEADDTRVALSARFDPAILASGLRAVLVAEIRELLEPGPAAARRGSAVGPTGRPAEGL
ncbi:MAG TPA: hypothetical protein VIL20_15640 [Sandaracinaceae bacterium]